MTAYLWCSRCVGVVSCEETTTSRTSSVARYRDDAGHRIQAPTNPTKAFLGLDRTKRK